MTINSVSPNPAINNQTKTNEVSSNTSLESNSFENYLAAETLPSIDTTKKPSIKELMDFTNMSFEDASSILYGVVGSNEDTRDWNKILTSSDVLKTAKEETAKMYNSYTAPLEEVVDETEENPSPAPDAGADGLFSDLLLLSPRPGRFSWLPAGDHPGNPNGNLEE